MKILLIINDAPYGTEKAYNALRLAMSLQLEDPSCEVRIFLLADAVTCILPNQETPKGFYNIEHMLKLVIEKGGQVKACGTCSNARGIKGLNLITGTEISTLKQLTQWTIDSDKVITF
ncbi:DsrE family protein [Candidatus Poribacteria bacterium]|nr:DsrE family protein [Candidatus Poribacteria bacterium]